MYGFTNWVTTFKVRTKDADQFIAKAHEIAPPTSGECKFWEYFIERKKLITEVNINPPSRGYAVDMTTDSWSKVAAFNKTLDQIEDEAREKLLALAIEYNGKVQTYQSYREGKFYEAKSVKLAEETALTIAKNLAPKVRAAAKTIADFLGDAKDLLDVQAIVTSKLEDDSELDSVESSSEEKENTLLDAVIEALVDRGLDRATVRDAIVNNDQLAWDSYVGPMLDGLEKAVNRSFETCDDCLTVKSACPTCGCWNCPKHCACAHSSTKLVEVSSQ